MAEIVDGTGRAVVVAGQQRKLDRRVRAVIVPKHWPAAEWGVTLADHLAQVVYSPSETAPVVGKRLKEGGRVLGVVVPERAPLAEQRVLNPAYHLNARRSRAAQY